MTAALQAATGALGGHANRFRCNNADTSANRPFGADSCAGGASGPCGTVWTANGIRNFHAYCRIFRSGGLLAHASAANRSRQSQVGPPPSRGQAGTLRSTRPLMDFNSACPRQVSQVPHVLVGSPRTSALSLGVVSPTGRHDVERIGLDQSFLVQQLQVRFRACRQATVLFVVNTAFGNAEDCPQSSRGRSSSWSCKAFRMSLSGTASRRMLCLPVVDCNGWFQVATRHHAKAITSGWSAIAVTISGTSNRTST